MGRTEHLSVSDWRDLYEGMTQEDDGFRKKMAERVAGLSADNILSELELAQNRLTYAMMGIHPIYRREIELSGFINYPEKHLALYADNGERIIPLMSLTRLMWNFWKTRNAPITQGTYSRSLPWPCVQARSCIRNLRNILSRST